MNQADLPGRQRELEAILRRAAPFAHADEGAIQSLASGARRKAWEAGTVLFQRDDAGDYLLALISGQVRLSVSSIAGKELVLRHMGPGDVVGEFSLIDGQPRSADATVISPSSGLILQRDHFLEVAARHPQLGLSVAQHLCQQLRNTNYQMESIALYDLRSRVARFLLFALKDQAALGKARLRLRLNQGEVALVVGASRPKVNQVMQAMLSDGVLEREGDLLLCDIERLEELAVAEAP
jgi:CRP-like cAMP-binding protein